MDGHIRAIQLTVLKERFVEVAEVGVERIISAYVELRRIGVAVESYRAARFDSEVLKDDVLKGEVIVTPVEDISAIHSQVFIGRAVVHRQRSRACGADLVAAGGIHHKGHRGLGSHIDVKVH